MKAALSELHCNLISSTIVSYFLRFWCCRRQFVYKLQQNKLGTGHKVTARVGWSDLGWAMENLWAVSMGRQFFCMSTVGKKTQKKTKKTKNKQKPKNQKTKPKNQKTKKPKNQTKTHACLSTSKNKDINNKSKQNYPNYQMQMMLSKPVLCLYNNKKWSNHSKYTTNWRVAQYRNW